MKTNREIFSGNLRHLRRFKKNGVADVAWTLQMKETNLRLLENGSIEPTLDELVKLSDYYGITINNLVETDCMLLNKEELKEKLK